jgi:hypothetical protein
MINVGLEQQQQIRGADGSLLWSGAQIVATDYMCISSEATASFAMGEAALFDGSTAVLGFIARQETTAAGGTPSADLPNTTVLYIKRTTAVAANDICFLGVLQDPCGPGKRAVVAGAGSITTVGPCAATIAIGFPIVSAGVVGQVTVAGAKSATVPAYGAVLGMCIKTNTGTPATPGAGTGSTTIAGCLVGPY